MSHERVSVDRSEDSPARPAPSTLAGPRAPAAIVLGLQRSAGNRAVVRALRLARFVDRDQLRVSSSAANTEQMQAELDRMRAIQEDQVDPGDRASLQTNVDRLAGHIAERSNSTLADASTSLLFDGETLYVSGTLNGSYPARSGRRREPSHDFDYSRTRQAQQNEGPIPEGVYWVRPSEYHNMLFHSGSFSGWGTHRLTIHPFDTTNTYGRGGFFIHGGYRWGSIGCIDLTNRVHDFIVRITQVPSDQKVKLTVSYPNSVVASPVDPVDEPWPAPDFSTGFPM